MPSRCRALVRRGAASLGYDLLLPLRGQTVRRAGAQDSPLLPAWPGTRPYSRASSTALTGPPGGPEKSGESGQAAESVPVTKKSSTLRQALWDQRHTMGNLALLFSCGLLAAKVSSVRREMEDTDATWRAKDEARAKEAAALGAELARVRSEVREQVQAGARDLGLRLSSVLEASEKRSGALASDPDPSPASSGLTPSDASKLNYNISQQSPKSKFFV